MHDSDGYFGEDVAARYDDPASEMFDPDAVNRTVDVLADLAGPGRALEFGIGTGRVALPLASRGVPVHGIDLSRAMVARLKAKPGGDAIGDFATTRVGGTYDVYDVATQATSSNYVEVVGGRGEFRSIPFRYVWRAELDLMAQLAGLRLGDRWGDWTREPFTGESRKHVSVWEKPIE